MLGVGGEEAAEVDSVDEDDVVALQSWLCTLRILVEKRG